MYRIGFRALAIAIVCVGLSTAAHAVTFEGTAIGSWVNVVSADPVDVFSVSNNDAGGVAAFNWGIAATTPFDNQFTFDGAGSNGAPGWSASSEAPFAVGSFSYRNGSTTNSAGVNGVDLSILLDVTTPLGVSDTYAFGFHITNTPNNTGNPVLDGDIVTVTSSFSPTSFIFDGTNYTLQLLGFSTDGGTSIRTDFSSPEGATAGADVYARITSNIPAVPEPGTIVLMGTGLVALTRATRKRCRK